MADNNVKADDQTEIINTDLYGIADTVNKLAKQYIPEMTEDTMSVGLPGYIIALESMKLKNTAIVTGALSNEVFPSRALLDKNIITHAIMQGVTGINATPSHMTIIIGLLLDDFERYAVTSDLVHTTSRFIFDKYCPMMIKHMTFILIMISYLRDHSVQPAHMSILQFMIFLKVQLSITEYLQ